MVRVRNKVVLKYQINGQTYVINPQSFHADCSLGVCRFKANGVNITASSVNFESANSLVSGSRTSQPNARVSTSNYNPAAGFLSSLQGYGGGGEVATGGDFDYIPQASYARTYSGASSRFSQCFQERADHYKNRRGCTSGNRNRCAGSKGSNISTNYCYRYVKLMLQDCGAASGYLAGAQAKNAGPELLRDGFTLLPTRDPNLAPVGSIIVYDNVCDRSHAGHIEIKTGTNEYASDYVSSSPVSDLTSCRKVTGIYYK